MSASTLIIASKEGQLCNRLFLFANVLASALENGWQVCNPSFAEYAADFESFSAGTNILAPSREKFIGRMLTDKSARCLRLASRTHLRRWPGGLIVDIRRSHDPLWRHFQLSCDSSKALFSSAKRVYLFGYMFRDTSALIRRRAEVTRWTLPIKEHRDFAESTIAEARRRGDVVVGVHLRQGDYKSYKGGRFHFDGAVYAAQMRATSKLLEPRKAAFIICTNGAVEMSDFAGMSVAVSGGAPVADLHVLSSCEFILGPPSSFSLWAAYAGGGRIFQLRSEAAIPELDAFKMFDSSVAP